MASFSEDLLNAVKGNYDGFSVRLREVPYTWNEDGLTVSGNFFYLTFRDGQPTVDEFVEFIYHKIGYFCISRRERNEKLTKFRETGNDRYIIELMDKAKALFVSARKSRKTSGEPGELILFSLLEAVLKAPQLVCKMSLKTNEDMPIHGSDAIHIAPGLQDGSLCLIWGESKIYQKFSDAINDACNSITEFLAEQDGRSSRDRDINIITEHMDIEDDSFCQALLNYFDPYCEENNSLEERYACFVGFDYAAYSKLTSMPVSERECFFKEKYLERIKSACQQFGEKIIVNKLSQLNINFFLIPFPSVGDLRKKFFSRLGVEP